MGDGIFFSNKIMDDGDEKVFSNKKNKESMTMPARLEDDYLDELPLEVYIAAHGVNEVVKEFIAKISPMFKKFNEGVGKLPESELILKEKEIEKVAKLMKVSYVVETARMKMEEILITI